MKLYDHQKKIIADDPKKCGIFLGTGSGKTITTLLLARKKTLVICPKTQRDDKNWERAARMLTLPSDFSLTVISKEEFRRDWKYLDRFDTVIVDEAHTCLGVTPSVRYRNRQAIPKTSQLFEALEQYVLSKNPERFYLVTATIVRSPMCVYAAMKLLGKEVDFYRFREQFYFRIPTMAQERWAPRRDDKTKQELAKIVRSIGYVGRLEDWFDVPEQLFVEPRYVQLTEHQKKRIKTLPLDFPDPIVLVGKKHQVENGVLAGDEYTEAVEFPNEKLAVLEDIYYEFPKMVVFAKYIAQIRQIEKHFKSLGKRVFVMTGATKDRGELLKYAEAAPEAIFVAQCQISSGYELPSFPCLVWASMSYSYVDYEQSIGRILRANHLKKNIYIPIVTKGGVDEAVYRSIINKKDFNEALYIDM